MSKDVDDPQGDRKPADIDSVEDLLSLIDATPVKIFQISAVRSETSIDDDATLAGTSHDVKVNLKLHRTDSFIEVRVRCQLDRPDVDIIVDVGIQFVWEQKVNYVGGDELVEQFARDFGVAFSISYVRPLIDQMTRTLELPTSTIPAILDIGVRE